MSAISEDIYGSAVGNMGLIVGNFFGGTTNPQDDLFVAKRLSEPSSSIQIWKMHGRPATVYGYRSMKPEIVNGNNSSLLRT